LVRRFVGYVGAALLLSMTAIAAVAHLGRDWEARVAVRGHSMEPSLRDGDWLLVNSRAFARRAPRPGELVVARDPRAADRIVVKRVAQVTHEQRIVLAGDHPAHAADGITISPGEVLGRPWFRYWPADAMGPVN
jgi:signal peptidase I